MLKLDNSISKSEVAVYKKRLREIQYDFKKGGALYTHDDISNHKKDNALLSAENKLILLPITTPALGYTPNPLAIGR